MKTALNLCILYILNRKNMTYDEKQAISYKILTNCI